MDNNKSFLYFKRGADIKRVAQYVVDVAKDGNKNIVCVYNGIKIDVTPETSVDYVERAFFSQAMTMPNMAMQQQNVK